MSTATEPVTIPDAPAGRRRRRSAARTDRRGRALWLRSADQVGRGVRITGPVLLRDSGSIVIGDDVVLDAARAPIELLAGPDGRLEIGPGAYVGPGASLEAGSSVVVGPGAVVGAYAKVLDNNWHGVEDRGTRPESLPVVIGAGARVGVRATMVPGSALGAGSVLADDSVLSGRVPAGVRVAGIPARLVGRVDPGRSETGGQRPDPVGGIEPFPQTDGGPLPSGPASLAWLAGWETLGRLAWGEAVHRRVGQARLAAGMLNAWRRLRSAELTHPVFALGSIDIAGPGRVAIGDHTMFMGGPLSSRIVAERGATVQIAGHVTVNYGLLIQASDRVDIGAGCLIGSRVFVTDRHEGRTGPVRIGQNVWLTHGVTVLPGVTIGDGSVISSGAVIDRDVPAASLAFGDPLRIRPLSTVLAAR